MNNNGANLTYARDCLPARRDLYIGGKWRPASLGGEFDIANPSTGESLGRVALATSEDVNEAVDAASRAYQSWRRTPPAERAAKLRRIAEIVRRNSEELALIDAIDGGAPIHEMAGDVANAAAQLE